MKQQYERLKDLALSQRELIEQAKAAGQKVKAGVASGQMSTEQAAEERKAIAEEMDGNSHRKKQAFLRLSFFGIGYACGSQGAEHVKTWYDLCRLVHDSFIDWRHYKRDQAQKVLDKIDKTIEEYA